VLVGHSIGGAISLLLAARRPQWPLLGIAVSGVALLLPPGGPGYEEDHPTGARVKVPDDVMNAARFGPPTSYAADAPERAAVANEPLVYQEIVEINTQWSPQAQGVDARVRVPVHYRLGEHDIMWAQGEDARTTSAARPASLLADTRAFVGYRAEDF
jgi:pimeloyl-ACP methyl ester carboxylesterase